MIGTLYFCKERISLLCLNINSLYCLLQNYLELDYNLIIYLVPLYINMLDNVEYNIYQY